VFNDSLPILMYHHVSSEAEGLSVSPVVFEEHLIALRRKGWKTLSGDEVIEIIHSRKIPNKCVVLTFDDGFADNYVYAYPLLKRYGMRAILFVTTSLIGDIEIDRVNFKSLPHQEAWRLAFTERRHEVMCTWSELREMKEAGIFDIQAHSHTHDTPSYIRGKRYSELKDDLLLCKRVLEEKLLKKVQHLSWPKGCYNDEAIRIATEVGFKALYTTERGPNTAENMEKIKRLSIKKDGGWLINRLNIYSSTFLSRLYLLLRWG